MVADEVSQERHNLKYKTELCKYFSQHGFCSKDHQCHYAHGEDELRAKRLSQCVNDGARLDPGEGTPADQFQARLKAGPISEPMQGPVICHIDSVNGQSNEPVYGELTRLGGLRRGHSTQDASYNPVLVRTGPPLCRFWQRGHCNQGTDCKFSHNQDLLHSIQKQQSFLTSEYRVSLHPTAPMAFVTFHALETYDSFASSPPKFVCGLRVAFENGHRDPMTVAIRFCGHQDQLDVGAITEEVGLRLRQCASVMLRHLLR